MATVTAMAVATAMVMATIADMVTVTNTDVVRVMRGAFNVNDLGIELGDGVCDFEKLLPNQLCPSAKRDL